MNDFLKQAYTETTYAISVDSLVFKLKIGEIHLHFNQWCQIQQVHTWCVITAFNPYSQVLPPQENMMRNDELQQKIMALTLKCYPALGIPSDSNWTPEPSFFIPNIEKTTAIELGQHFQQNAIVFAEKNQKVELLVLV